jgi:hypothetical protein
VRRYGSCSASPETGEVHHPLGLVDVQDLPHLPLPEVTCPSSSPVRRSTGTGSPSRPAASTTAPRRPAPNDRRLGHPLVGLHARGVALAEHGDDLASGRFQPVQMSVRRSRGWLR